MIWRTVVLIASVSQREGGGGAGEKEKQTHRQTEAPV